MPYYEDGTYYLYYLKDGGDSFNHSIYLTTTTDFVTFFLLYTQQINLMPFTLAACAEYAASRGIVINRHQLLECYMAMGGVPYYWGFLRKELSLSQNIDQIIFAKNAPLKEVWTR